MKESYKIVFTGPVGAGKTSAITALSDVPIISTNENASDMTISKKPQTTVAMDYGILYLDENTKVHLYGTPGQERFEFMWEILTKGGLGLVLMLDNTRANPKKDFLFFLRSFKNYVQEVPVVIGVSKMDIAATPNIDNYYQMLEEVQEQVPIFNPVPPIFEIDGRNKDDIKTLVMSLLYSIDPGISAQAMER